MKFMLMMNAPRGNGDWSVAEWRPTDIKAMVNFMKAFGKKLAENGELVAAEGLTAPAQAKLVRASRETGLPETDGPFAETKEFLAGFWIVDVENAERAYAIAAEASLSPGPGGKPMHQWIEVRPVGTAPKVDADA
jgi:hypothetical protein